VSERIFDQYWAAVDALKVTERKDPTFGPVTIFHDVVLAREIVQPYNIDGKTLMAYKSADELERYWRWIEGRWAIAGHHPSTPVIVSPDDIAGRTVNVRFVKNLIDHAKTERPNIRGIIGDLEVFNNRVAPEILAGMKDGSLPDVSIGFLYAKEMNKGNWNGSDYDFRQVNMFHDHLAFGIRKGRCTFPFCGIGADTLFNIEKSLYGIGGKIDMTHMAIVGRDPEETEENIHIPAPEVTAKSRRQSRSLRTKASRPRTAAAPARFAPISSRRRRAGRWRRLRPGWMSIRRARRQLATYSSLVDAFTD